MEKKDDLFAWKHLRLWRISSLANFLSSIVIIVYIFLVIWQIFQDNEWSLAQHNINFLGYLFQKPVYIFVFLTQIAGLILQGAVYHLALKGIAHGLDMIVETDINYREKKVEGGEE